MSLEEFIAEAVDVGGEVTGGGRQPRLAGLAHPPRPDEHDRPPHPGFLYQLSEMGKVVAPGPARLVGINAGAPFPPRVIDAQTALDLLQGDFEC